MGLNMVFRLRDIRLKISERRARKKAEYAMRWPNERGARYVFAKIGTRFFGAGFNDFAFGALKKVDAGAVRLTDLAAIYLIFPKDGVLQSHLESLEYLCRKGYAPIVVSNLKLSDADRAKLRQRSCFVIERHNFGYDFGGYRDGILQIREYLPKLQRLAIFNDSVWFPVKPHDDWLEKAEKLNQDYVGATSHFGIKRQAVKDFRSLDWSYDTAHPIFHYASYALSIGPAILCDRRFLKFWERLPLTNIKRLVIRRGEAGLTQWVIRNGYTHAATLDLESLDQEIRSLDQETLQKLVEGLTFSDAEQELSILRGNLIQSGNNPPEHLANLILASVMHQGASYSIAEYIITQRGFEFLKKSPIWLSKDSSRITTRFCDTLGGTIQREAAVLALRAPQG